MNTNRLHLYKIGEQEATGELLTSEKRNEMNEMEVNPVSQEIQTLQERAANLERELCGIKANIYEKMLELYPVKVGDLIEDAKTCDTYKVSKISFKYRWPEVYGCQKLKDGNFEKAAHHIYRWRRLTIAKES
jgi:hypothetical protein